MKKLKRKNQRKLATSAPQSIGVLVYDKAYKDKELKTISTQEILDKFPKSRAGQIYREHNFRFVTCFKAFLETYFGSKVEPINEIQEITGLGHKEIGLFEQLCRNKMKV